MAYLSLLVPTSVCWILDQQLCEQMNSKDGFNPQLHAWWHVFLAIDFHLSAVCAEAMRRLSIKYQQHQKQASIFSFKPADHVHIVFYCGLPFLDYSKTEQIKKQ